MREKKKSLDKRNERKEQKMKQEDKGTCGKKERGQKDGRKERKKGAKVSGKKSGRR